MGTRDFLQRDYFEHESHEFNEYFILHTDPTDSTLSLQKNATQSHKR